MKKQLGIKSGILLVIAGLMMTYTAPLFAQNDKGKDKTEKMETAQETVAAGTAADMENQKKQTVNYLQEMGNQEMRVIVLGQLYNQEAGLLKQKQALFCDLYKLDIEKWRKGLYRYDDKTGKFLEKEAVEKK